MFCAMQCITPMLCCAVLCCVVLCACCGELWWIWNDGGSQGRRVCHTSLDSARRCCVLPPSVGQVGAQDIAAALGENDTITSVKLRENPIGNAGVAVILSALLNNHASKLECIDCRCGGGPRVL